eukprot:UN07835
MPSVQHNNKISTLILKYCTPNFYFACQLHGYLHYIGSKMKVVATT